jgi:hypothetical protein
VGNITAAWLNGIIANTNTVLGTTVSSVSTGQRITSSIFSNLITTAQNAAAAAGYDLNWPPLTSVAVGQKITLLAFPPPVDLPINYETVRWTVPGTYTWVVPTAIPAITAVCFNWIIAGGGSGGSGTQGASGGGGGGGGSGGNHQYSVVPCKTGDKFSVTIGAGGAVGTFGGGGAGLQGQAGGSTIVALNGQVIYQATGGAGGLACLGRHERHSIELRRSRGAGRYGGKLWRGRWHDWRGRLLYRSFCRFGWRRIRLWRRRWGM